MKYGCSEYTVFFMNDFYKLCNNQREWRTYNWARLLKKPAKSKHRRNPKIDFSRSIYRAPLWVRTYFELRHKGKLFPQLDWNILVLSLKRKMEKMRPKLSWPKRFYESSSHKQKYQMIQLQQCCRSLQSVWTDQTDQV